MASVKVKEYVLGFMFHPNLREAVFIRKIKGKHAGMLNGVGGKIELCEHPLAAMAREFQEETSVVTTALDWLPFGVFHGTEPNGVEEYMVHCFATSSLTGYLAACTVTPEYVERCPIGDLWDLEPTPNLLWLVSMASYRLRGTKLFADVHIQ